MDETYYMTSDQENEQLVMGINDKAHKVQQANRSARKEAAAEAG